MDNGSHSILTPIPQEEEQVCLTNVTSLATEVLDGGDSGSGEGSGPVPPHNSLTGLQGGTPGQRYHIDKGTADALAAANGASVSNPFLTNADVVSLISILATPPTYVAPVLVLNGSTLPTTLEAGSTVVVTLTGVFTQNDGGTVVSRTITKNSVPVAATLNFSESVKLSTTAISYQAVVEYGQGPIKTNNLSIPDATGRIPAGSKSSVFALRGYQAVFYGAAAAIPTNTAQARALPQYALNSNSFILNTGTTHLRQFILLPQGKSITSVIDLDALNLNITSEYTIITNAFPFLDLSGTPVTGYNLWARTQGVAYDVNHRQQFTLA